MADPRQRGVTLISATESVDDTPVGQLMHGILATFNEYQSRESGADIAYKMGQKARNGGTIGRARLGYLNHTDRTDGRDIRTIIIDPERAPLVRLGFELFAADNLTLDELSERLYQQGLRTRPTARHPAQRVSISKLARMLRDRYYLGYITYRDEELPGRHEPLIDQHLFDRVRRRDEYTYFFCRNRQQGTCPAPYVNVAVAEQAVERYYTTVSQQQITDALATLTAVDTADHDPSRTRDRSRSTGAAPTTSADYSTTHSSASSTSPTTTSPTTNHGRRHP
jgi:site-specific DNA recombinase